MKTNMVLVLAFYVMLISCNSTSKEEGNEEATKEITIEEPIKAESKILEIDPIEFFNSLEPAKGESIFSVEDIPAISDWTFDVFYFGSNTRPICASSESGESILFAWDYDTKKYVPFVLQPKPEVAENVSFNQIKTTEYRAQDSKSIEIFTNDFRKEYALEKNRPIKKVSDVQVANDSLYITTAKGVLSFLNVIIAGDGDGDILDCYFYISHIGNNYIVLKKIGYNAELRFVNLISGNSISEYGEVQNLHISPNLKYAAIIARSGDTDYDLDGNPTDCFLTVYDLSYDKPELIFETELGPNGHSSGLKWVSDDEFLTSTYCQNYSFTIGQPYGTVRDPELIDALRNAIKKEDLARVTKLMEQGVDANYSRYPWPFPPIVEACRLGNLAILEELIKYGADPKVSYTDEANNTYYPVDIAINEGHFDLVKSLYSIGAKSAEPMGNVNEEDEEMYAFLQEQGMVINEVYNVGEDYSYKLFDVLQSGDIQESRTLVDQGAIIRDDLGWLATTVEQFNFLKENNYDFTLLNNIQIKDWPYIASVFSDKSTELLNLLLEAGVRPSATSLILLFGHSTNFDIALKYLSAHYQDFDINDSFIYKPLAIQPPFFGYEKTNNTTLLSMAVVALDIDVIKILLANGADPTVKDVNGKLPIDFASDNFREETLVQLFKEYEQN
jgi:ankyrin repeat protein